MIRRIKKASSTNHVEVNGERSNDDFRNKKIELSTATASDEVADINDAYKPIDTSSAQKLMPYNRSVFFHILNRDCRDKGCRWIPFSYIAITIVSLGLTPFVQKFVINRVSSFQLTDVSFYDTWDEDHGIVLWDEKNNDDGSYHLAEILPALLHLIEKALGIPSQETVKIFFWGALFPYMILFCIDLFDIPCGLWPISWNTHNNRCYMDMFCEPTRFRWRGENPAASSSSSITDSKNPRPCLIRRLGNTYSNVIFLFGAECIILSNIRFHGTTSHDEQNQNGNYFWFSDTIFGVMLLILSIMSTIWHGCNAPRVHYLDLWSMDSCIIYTAVRPLCMGGLGLALERNQDSEHALRSLTSYVCSALYIALILSIGRYQYMKYLAGYLDGGFPLSCRFLVQNDGVTVFRVCAFIALPVYGVIIGLPLELLIFHSEGSRIASSLALNALLIGWGLRIFERFLFDGWGPMNWIASVRNKILRSPVSITPERASRMDKIKHRVSLCICTLMAALVSPTALLHFFTGITLLFNYIHWRTFD